MIYYASWQHKLKTYIHKTIAGNDYKKANTHIHMQSHKNLNILQNYSIEQTIGNGKTRIACSADTGSNSQKNQRNEIELQSTKSEAHSFENLVLVYKMITVS